MNRLAVFVEGYTEVMFVEKLIGEIAGENRVDIEWRQIRGGSTVRRTMALGQGSKRSTGQNYYVLIFDCGGDHQVKPRIIEEHENLTKKGYLKIIGMRDVRPNYSHSTLDKLEQMLPRYIRTSLIPVEWVLAILEIEAWFLTEHTHLEKIDSRITTANIKTALGIDLENDRMDQRLCPAEDIASCYALGGKAYLKRNAKETVDALDMSSFYLQLSNEIPYLQQLCCSIEDFLATPPI